MPQFETFKKSLVPPSRPPLVTVHRRGTITINSAAFAELGEPEAVELLFDRTTTILGLRTVEPGVAHAAFVRPAHKRGHGPYVISAMAFVRYFGIDTSDARRWEAILDDGTLCVDLSQPGVVVSRPRPDVPQSVRRTPRARPPGSAAR